MQSDDESKGLAQVQVHLVTMFPSVDSGELERVVEEIHSDYAGARVRAYIPILVEREVREVVAGSGRSAHRLSA